MKNEKQRTAAQIVVTLCLGAGMAAAMACYYDVYVHWQPNVFPYTVAALTAGVLVLTLFALWLRGERRLALLWKSVLSVAVFTAVLHGVSYYINIVVGHESMARQAAAVALPLCAVQILALLILALRAVWRPCSRGVRAALALALAGALALGAFLGSLVRAPQARIKPQFPAPRAALEKPREDDYALWAARAEEFFTGDLSSLVSADSGALAWGTSYTLNAFCRAYQATGEAVYLEKAGGYLYEIFQLAEDNDGDGYKNWGTGTYSQDEYQEWCVHTGALLSAAGEWANLVCSAPGILEEIEPVSGMAYGALCAYLVDEAAAHLIPAFDRDWDEALGIYMNRPGSGNFSGSTAKISLPNNQFLAMAAALVQFAKLSPAHEAEYLRRAKAMLEAFRAKLAYDENGNITKWNYKDIYFEGDMTGGVEDHSHGRWDFRAALMGYANGLVFTRRDIEAFAGVYRNMLRGVPEEPLLTWNVDGSGTAKDPVGLFHYDLSPFGEDIWRAGQKTAVLRGAAEYAMDAARILAYHEYAPPPLEFGLLEAHSRQAGRVLFRWEVSIHACKYTLQISDDESFSNLLLDRADILDTCAFVEGLPEGKTLYWRVIAANQGGGSCTSEAWEVTA